MRILRYVNFVISMTWIILLYFLLLYFLFFCVALIENKNEEEGSRTAVKNTLIPNRPRNPDLLRYCFLFSVPLRNVPIINFMVTNNLVFMQDCCSDFLNLRENVSIVWEVKQKSRNNFHSVYTENESFNLFETAKAGNFLFGI